MKKFEPRAKTIKTNNRKINVDNAQLFIDDGININDRIIHLFDEITEDAVSKVIRGIQLMLAKNTELPISIYINSQGGCIYSGLGLYAFIRSLKVPIKIYVIGTAMSAASIILMAGDERYAYEESTIMLHSVSSKAEGKAHLNLKDEAEECIRIHDQMCHIYASHSKQDFKYWVKKIKFSDFYIREDKALELGLIDFIIKSE